VLAGACAGELHERRGGVECSDVNYLRSALDGKRGALERQPTKHVRTHTHKLKPLNHLTVVPHVLSPLRFNNVDRVLRLLRDAGVTLFLPNCRFFRKTVEYLGHEIKPGGLGITDAHTRALYEAQFPATRTEVRSSVGMRNVFRRFVPIFARMAAPFARGHYAGVY